MKVRERKVFFVARGASTAVVGAVCGLSLAPPGPIGPCNVLILMHWEITIKIASLVFAKN